MINKTKVLQIRLSELDWTRLKVVSEEFEITSSEFVREIIRTKLDKIFIECPLLKNKIKQ